MRKPFLIGLIVCLVAIGGIGAAFATGMNLTNVGALSAGTAAIPQADVDGITWWVNQGYSGATAANPWVDEVTISFNRDLPAGTEIGFAVFDAGGTCQVNVWGELPAALLASDSVDIDLTPGNAPLGDLINMVVTTAPPDPWLGVPVKAVNYISAIVSEETAP